MIDLDALENLARAATPGPWATDDPWIVYAKVHDEIVYLAKTAGLDTTRTQYPKDADYIAAANPSVILDLIGIARAAADSLPKIKEVSQVPQTNEAQLRAALRKAHNTGQTYFSLADSEYSSSHKKADQLAASFAEFIEEQVKLLAGAAPVEAAKNEGWQPIETAPKKIIKQLGGQGYGAYILASNGYDVVRCRWWQHVDGSSNFIKDGGLSFHATHWMNLPAAPAPEAQ